MPTLFSTGAAQSTRPRVLGLVADDLTGAADSAAGFAEQGWTVVLCLDLDALGAPPQPGSGTPTVLAVSTGVRAWGDGAATEATARAVHALAARGAERLYVKVDSTVRGSVAGQVEGALSAWSRSHPGASAVLCPAFPGQHRTVVEGAVLVGGVPVHQTAAGVDPLTPRTISDLTAIVPGAVRGAVAQSGQVRRLVVDAATDDDLDALAAELAGAGPEVVMVGSGGLAAALGRAWSHPRVATAEATAVGGRLLLAVSSRHPVTAAQLLHLDTHPLADHADVLTTRSEPMTSPAAAAADLAERVADALRSQAYDALVLVGGDGAAAVLTRLAVDRILVDGSIEGGCPTGRVDGGPAHGLRVVTKSGGFGEPATLATILGRIRRSAPDQSVQ